MKRPMSARMPVYIASSLPKSTALPCYNAKCNCQTNPSLSIAVSLYNPFDLCKSISYRLRTPKRAALFLPTSKNRFNHQTWKIHSPIKTPIWKILHHLTLPFVLSAVLRWVLSRTTI